MDRRFMQGDKVANRYTGATAVVTDVYWHDDKPAVDVTYDGTAVKLSGYETAFTPAQRASVIEGFASTVLDELDHVAQRVNDLCSAGAIDEYSASSILDSLTRAVGDIHSRATANRYRKPERHID